MSKEIPLAEWAADNDVPPRTASSWAQTGKIPATKRKRIVKLTVSRKVETYFVPAGTKVPS